MTRTLNGRWQAVFCAVALPLAGLLIRPQLESGLVDDWSYTRMAQVLAKTGHYAYNGWETPMMGYLIFLGAFFARVFGPSFTAIRLSVLLLASITGFLLQRLLLRWGLTSWNATAGTLAFLFSPLFLVYTFTFFTDVPGIFGMVVCFYCGTRALQASKEQRTCAWLVLAAICGIIGGTCRQTVWLGAVVMVPSIALFLRRSKPVLITAAVSTLASAAAAAAMLRWFNHQPYSQPEALVRHVSLSKEMSNFLYVSTHTVPVMAFLLVPVLLAFSVPALRSSRIARLLMVAGFALTLPLALLEYHRHSLGNWLALVPATSRGGIGQLTFMGATLGETSPVYGPLSLGIFWIVMLFAVFGFLGFCLSARWKAPVSRAAAALSWEQLGWLLLPFTAGYLVLLLPRALYEEVFGRYLLPLLLVIFPLLFRVYQERVSPRLPALSLAFAAVVAVLTIAGMHDGFAESRAKVEAYDVLLHAGLHPTEIDGGGELNGIAQLDRDGYVHDPRTLLPDGTRVIPTVPDPRFCEPLQQILFPSIKPRYALSFRSDLCGGPSDFPPVTYRQWLGAPSRQIFIVKEPSGPSLP